MSDPKLLNDQNPDILDAWEMAYSFCRVLGACSHHSAQAANAASCQNRDEPKDEMPIVKKFRAFVERMKEINLSGCECDGFEKPEFPQDRLEKKINGRILQERVSELNELLKEPKMQDIAWVRRVTRLMRHVSKSYLEIATMARLLDRKEREEKKSSGHAFVWRMSKN